MKPIVRFAPSPTGLLHVGNIRTALLNWLFARKADGAFILRLDDTDTGRSDEAFARQIVEDLDWLGLDHDGLEYQSTRFDRYAEAVETLKAAGRLYPCYETPEELDLKRKIALGRGRPPVYDRAALSLEDSERASLEAEGRRPHWRFLLDLETVAFPDMIHGTIEVDVRTVSDPVLIREDGQYLYTLPSICDDIDFGVTHIIRGDDHITNTGVQIQIFRALGGQVPEFGHHGLLKGPDGEALSKRLGSLSVKSLREDEIEPMAILSLLAKIGTSDPIEARSSLDELVDDFSIAKVGRATVRFDPAELRALNATIIHAMPFDDVRARLRDYGIDADEAFWEAVRPNLERLRDAEVWWRVVRGPIEPVIEDADVADAARRTFPHGTLDEEAWKTWTDAIKAETGRKGRALFMPLRLALTGLDHGPEMKKLLSLIGRERAMARLGGEKA